LESPEVPLVTIDYDLGLPGVEIATMVAEGLHSRLVIALDKGEASLAAEIKSRRLNRLEEALLRIAQASGGARYIGLGPAADPPSPESIRELEQAAAQEQLVVAACHFGAELLSREPETIHVFATASLTARSERLVRMAALDLLEAREFLHLADVCAMAYRQTLTRDSWPSSEHHHLILDTSSLDEVAAAGLILSYVRRSRRY